MINMSEAAATARTLLPLEARPPRRAFFMCAAQAHTQAGV